MTVGSSTRIPDVRISEDDMGEPTVHIYQGLHGITIAGTLETADGNVVRDPNNNGKAFQLELGIEDWTVAMTLGADLIAAALRHRAEGLRQIRYAEDEDAKSALLNPPTEEELP